MQTENLVFSSTDEVLNASSGQTDIPVKAVSRLNWDRIGIWASAFCVLHCLFTPVALLAVPVVGAQFGHGAEVFHLLMAAFLIPVAVVAFYRSYRLRRDMKALMLGAGGVSILLFALVMHEVFHDSLAHTAINVVGSVVLISGHLRNRRLAAAHCGRSHCGHAH